MAKLALIYGMRLLPADELEKVGDAEVTLKNGKKANVTHASCWKAAKTRFASN